MQVRHVPALTGWRWVTEGFSILARAPMPLIAAGILMLFTLVVLSAPPLLGTFLPLVLSPALSFGYLQAIRRAQEGKPPGPWTLYSGLRPGAGSAFRSLLIIGVINAVATAAALTATIAIDGGDWLRLLTDSQQRPASATNDADTLYAALIFMILYAPIQVSLWYAPLFAGLHRTPPVKALVFSAVAVWRNKGAFFFYFAGWFAVAVGLSVAMRLLISLMPDGLRVLVLAPMSILMLAALYCSFWPTYRDTIDPIAVDAIV